MADLHLLEFTKGRHSAYMDLVDGKWEYGGDMPVKDSAKAFFEAIADMFDEHIAKNFTEIEKRYNEIRVTVVNGDIKIKQ